MIRIILLLAILFVGCKSSVQPPLFESKLEASQIYNIDVTRDTVLRTQGGAILKIPAGALAPDSGNTAKLELLEAYDAAAILRNGLTTLSNGQWLSSGGMMRITQGGRKLLKPIKVKLVTDNYSPDMMLYTGDTSNGRLNWTNPRKLDPVVDSGYVLFTQKCSSCHGIDKVLTAPALGRVGERIPDREALKVISDHHYTSKDSSNSGQTSYRSTVDLYLCNLRKYYGAVGPRVNVSNDERDLILNYISRKSDSMNLPHQEVSRDWLGADSCFRQSQALAMLYDSLEIESKMDTVPSEPEQSAAIEFSIESFGWYNLDYLYDTRKDLSPAYLLVRAKGFEPDSTWITLFLPSCKTYVDGQYKNGDFDFSYGMGQLKLPMNQSGLIVSRSRNGSREYFGVAKFTIKPDNKIDLKLNEGTEAEYNAMMKSLSLGWPEAEPQPLRPRTTGERLQQKIDSVNNVRISFPCDCGIYPDGEDYIMDTTTAWEVVP